MTGSIVEFGVLGPLVLKRDGEASELPSGRPRRLLALLLATDGGPISRDRLIDGLWGERPPASAVSAFHVHLSRLRAELGDLLQLGPSGYSLRPGGFTLDVWRFDEIVARARREPGGAGPLLQEADGLVRGAPLADVEDDDADGAITRWRRALGEKLLDAALVRIDVEIAAGTGADVITRLERLHAEHPYDERIAGRLLLALYTSGRTADALDRYQRVRQRLVEDLGITPGQQLVDLQQQILAAGSQPPRPVQPTQPMESNQAAAAAPRSGLPRPPTALVAREAELSQLTALLLDPDVRLISVTGAGGVGKTRLALELARRHEPAFAHGAAFVQLERVTDPELVGAQIATTMSRLPGFQRIAPDLVVDALAEREMLLVLDNFEHLLSTAGFVSEILAAAPAVRLVVTSRSALRLRGEHVFPVTPLALPASENDAAVADSPAVQLFLRLLLAIDRELPIDRDLSRDAATICRAVDGLPLAIELAAARAGSVGIDRVVNELAEPLMVGRNQLRDLPDRQQTLEATIRWSYVLLSPAAQRVLRAASVFVGGFTVPALHAVADIPVQPALEELMEASLARRGADDQRFHLLRLVHSFARSELDGDGADELAARHRTYFSQHIVAVRRSLPAEAWTEGVARALAPDHPNYRAALEDALAADDRAAMVALATGMRALWFAGTLRQEAIDFATRILTLDHLPPDFELRMIAVGSVLEPSLEGATAWSRRLADQALARGDSDRYAVALHNLFDAAAVARDRDAIGELRGELEAALVRGGSAFALSQFNLALAAHAYMSGRFADAVAFGTAGAEHAAEAQSINLIAQTRELTLLASTARAGAITHAELVDHLEQVRGLSVDRAIIALWFVARYAAGVGADTAARWLACAEHLALAAGSEIWPEGALRAETMALLGIADAAAFAQHHPVLDEQTALDEAAGWLAARDAGESSPRENALHFVA